MAEYGTFREASRRLHISQSARVFSHLGLAISWDPRNEGLVVQNFLRLVRASKERIRRNA